MILFQTNHPEVLRIQPLIYEDKRGSFFEAYQKQSYSEIGIPFEFVQDNQSTSIKNTLRGLHYQISHMQGKLVRAVSGIIFDVAVDLRKTSPFFGKWVGAVLSEDNRELLWVPPGFAHGFFVLSQRAVVLYKTTDYYDSDGERCIKWNDPDLAIDWPIPQGCKPILSKKDAEGTSFSEAEVFL
jgi:dTDP-4-dehydrorhamnose 3,5-epimerase